MKKFPKISDKIRKKIVGLERKKHHPLTHHVHRKHGISHKTLLYMKEYGPKSHVYHVIVKESLRVLILASLISSIGGFSLQLIGSKIVSIIPLLILLPALNNMIGSYGTIISSKFTIGLYTGKVGTNWWRSEYTHKLFVSIFLISIFSTIYISLLSSGIAYIKGFGLTFDLVFNILKISFVATMLLVGIIFLVSVALGWHFYKKQEDPNNFLIPITTSIADFGSMIVFMLMVSFLF